jgi:hypothetical protein
VHAAQRPRSVRTSGTNDRSGSGPYKNIASGQKQLCDRRAEFLFQPIKFVSPFGTDSEHLIGQFEHGSDVWWAAPDLNKRPRRPPWGDLASREYSMKAVRNRTTRQAASPRHGVPTGLYLSLPTTEEMTHDPASVSTVCRCD